MMNIAKSKNMYAVLMVFALSLSGSVWGYGQDVAENPTTGQKVPVVTLDKALAGEQSLQIIEKKSASHPGFSEGPLSKNLNGIEQFLSNQKQKTASSCMLCNVISKIWSVLSHDVHNWKLT